MNLLRRIADAEARGCMLLEARPQADGTPSVFRESVWGATALYGTFAVLGFAAYRRSVALAEEEEKAKLARRAKAKIVTAPSQVAPWEKTLSKDRSKAIWDLIGESVSSIYEPEPEERAKGIAEGRLTKNHLQLKLDKFKLKATAALGGDDPAVEWASDYFLSQMLVTLQRLSKAAEKSGDEEAKMLAEANLMLAGSLAQENWSKRLFRAVDKAAKKVVTKSQRFGFDVMVGKKNEEKKFGTRDDFASDVLGETMVRTIDTLPDIVEQSMKTGRPIYDIIEQDVMQKTLQKVEGAYQRRGGVSASQKSRYVKSPQDLAAERGAIRFRGGSNMQVELNEGDFQEIAPGVLMSERVVEVPGEGKRYVVSYIPSAIEYIDESGNKAKRDVLAQLTSFERETEQVDREVSALQEQRQSIEAMVRDWFTDERGRVNQRLVDKVLVEGDIQPVLQGKSQSEVSRIVDEAAEIIFKDKVAALQKKARLPETGVLDEATLARTGLRGKAVQELQESSKQSADSLVRKQLEKTVGAVKRLKPLSEQLKAGLDRLSDLQEQIAYERAKSRQSAAFADRDQAVRYFESLRTSAERNLDKISERFSYLQSLAESGQQEVFDEMTGQTLDPATLDSTLQETVEAYEQAALEAQRSRKQGRVAGGFMIMDPVLEEKASPTEARVERKYYLTRLRNDSELVPNAELASKVGLGRKGKQAIGTVSEKLEKTSNEIVAMELEASASGKPLTAKQQKKLDALKEKRLALQTVLSDTLAAAKKEDEKLSEFERDLKKRIAEIGTTKIDFNHPYYPKLQKEFLVEELFETDEDGYRKYMEMKAAGVDLIPVEVILDESQFDLSNPEDVARRDQAIAYYEGSTSEGNKTRGKFPEGIKTKDPAPGARVIPLGSRALYTPLLGDDLGLIADKVGLHRTAVISRAGDYSYLEAIGGTMAEVEELAPRDIEGGTAETMRRGIARQTGEAGFAELLSESVKPHMRRAAEAPEIRFERDYPLVLALLRDESGDVDEEALESMMEGDFDRVIGGGKKNAERDKLVAEEVAEMLANPSPDLQGLGEKQRLEKVKKHARGKIDEQLKLQLDALKRDIEKRVPLAKQAKVVLTSEIERGLSDPRQPATYAVRMSRFLSKEFGRPVGADFLENETYAEAARKRAVRDRREIEKRLSDPSVKGNDRERLIIERANIDALTKALSDVTMPEVGAVEEARATLARIQKYGDVLEKTGKALERKMSPSARAEGEKIQQVTARNLRIANEKYKRILEENPEIDPRVLQDVQERDVLASRIQEGEDTASELYAQWERSFNRDLRQQGLADIVPSASDVTNELIAQSMLLRGDSGAVVPVEIALSDVANQRLEYGANLVSAETAEDIKAMNAELDATGQTDAPTYAQNVAEMLRQQILSDAAEGDPNAAELAQTYDLQRPLGRAILEEPVFRDSIYDYAVDHLESLQERLSSATSAEDVARMSEEIRQATRLAGAIDASRTKLTFQDLDATRVGQILTETAAPVSLVDTFSIEQQISKLKDSSSYNYDLDRRLSEEGPATGTTLAGEKVAIGRKIFEDPAERKRAVATIDEDLWRIVEEQNAIGRRLAQAVDPQERELLQISFNRLENRIDEATRLKEAIFASMYKSNLEKLKEYNEKYPQAAQERKMKPVSVRLGPKDLYDRYQSLAGEIESLRQQKRGNLEERAWLQYQIEQGKGTPEARQALVKVDTAINQADRVIAKNEELIVAIGDLTKGKAPRSDLQSYFWINPDKPDQTIPQTLKLVQGESPVPVGPFQQAYRIGVSDKFDDFSLVDLAYSRQKSAARAIAPMYKAVGAQIQLDERQRKKSLVKTAGEQEQAPQLASERPFISPQTVEAQKAFESFTRSLAKKDNPWARKIVARLDDKTYSTLGELPDGNPILIPQDLVDPGGVVETISLVREENERIKNALAAAKPGSQDETRAIAALATVSGRTLMPVEKDHAKKAILDLLDTYEKQSSTLEQVAKSVANAEGDIKAFQMREKRLPRKPTITEEAKARRYAKGSSTVARVPVKARTDGPEENYWIVKAVCEENKQNVKGKVQKTYEKLMRLVPDRSAVDRLIGAFRQLREASKYSTEQEELAKVKLETEFTRELPQNSMARSRAIVSDQNEIVMVDETSGKTSLLDEAAKNFSLERAGVKVGSIDEARAAEMLRSARESLGKVSRERMTTLRMMQVTTQKAKLVRCPACNVRTSDLLAHSIAAHSKK